MVKPPPPSLSIALSLSLAPENVWDEEADGYRCHACNCTTDLSDVGGCTNPNCWVESAEQLQRLLASLSPSEVKDGQ